MKRETGIAVMELIEEVSRNGDFARMPTVEFWRFWHALGRFVRIMGKIEES